MQSFVLLAALTLFAFALAATTVPVPACPGEHCPTLP